MRRPGDGPYLRYPGDVRWGIVSGMATRHPPLTGDRGDIGGACKAELDNWRGARSIPEHSSPLARRSRQSPNRSGRNGPGRATIIV